jgi:RHS repeat-associated protein
VYIEGRPVAVILSHHSTATDETTDGTFWIHTDHLGTPILVTQSDRTDRWRWENDPFGRLDPFEYTVHPHTVGSEGNPPYNTCCCTTCGVSGCGTSNNSCASNCCLGGGHQARVWQYQFGGLAGTTNIRLHFSKLDVHAGSTRTGSDYVILAEGHNTYNVAFYTGNIGAFWTPWIASDSALVELITDNVADTTSTAGLTVDKYEYATSSDTKFTAYLRMPGQIWDTDVKAAYNYHRWYRREDGRYLSPDPIGLAGGEPAYFPYVNSNPLAGTDPNGLRSGPLGSCSDPRECLGRESLSFGFQPTNPFATRDFGLASTSGITILEWTCTVSTTLFPAGIDQAEVIANRQFCIDQSDLFPDTSDTEVLKGIACAKAGVAAEQQRDMVQMSADKVPGSRCMILINQCTCHR